MSSFKTNQSKYVANMIRKKTKRLKINSIFLRKDTMTKNAMYKIRGATRILVYIDGKWVWVDSNTGKPISNG